MIDRSIPVGAAGGTGARRDEILAAALDVFAAQGYKGATIKALAAAAGLRSPALLYWYFPNKEVLFRAVLERYLPVLDEDTLTGNGRDATPEAFLATLMRTALARFADPATGKAYWLLVREHARLEQHGFSMGTRSHTMVTLVVDYLRRQMTRGTLRRHDPDAVARLLVAQLNLALQMRVVPMGLLPPVADEVLIAETLDIVLDGIRP